MNNHKNEDLESLHAYLDSLGGPPRASFASTTARVAEAIRFARGGANVAQLRALLSPLGIDRWEVQDGTVWITALQPWCRGRNLVASAARLVLGPGWRVELGLDPVAPPAPKLHDVTAVDPEPQQASADPDVTRTRDLRREIEAAGGNMEGP